MSAVVAGGCCVADTGAGAAAEKRQLKLRQLSGC